MSASLITLQSFPNFDDHQYQYGEEEDALQSSMKCSEVKAMTPYLSMMEEIGIFAPPNSGSSYPWSYRAKHVQFDSAVHVRLFEKELPPMLHGPETDAHLCTDNDRNTRLFPRRRPDRIRIEPWHDVDVVLTDDDSDYGEDLPDIPFSLEMDGSEDPADFFSDLQHQKQAILVKLRNSEEKRNLLRQTKNLYLRKNHMPFVARPESDILILADWSTFTAGPLWMNIENLQFILHELLTKLEYSERKLQESKTYYSLYQQYLRNCLE